MASSSVTAPIGGGDTAQRSVNSKFWVKKRFRARVARNETENDWGGRNVAGSPVPLTASSPDGWPQHGNVAVTVFSPTPSPTETVALAVSGGGGARVVVNPSAARRPYRCRRTHTRIDQGSERATRRRSFLRLPKFIVVKTFFIFAAASL